MALPYLILRGMSRPRFAALRRAVGYSGGAAAARGGAASAAGEEWPPAGMLGGGRGGGAKRASLNLSDFVVG